MSDIPRVKPGDPLTAESWNALVDALERARIHVGPDSGLVAIPERDGTTLAAPRQTWVWGKTTGAISGGTYPFQALRETASGAWINGAFTATAYETSGNTGVATNTIARFFRTAAGDWRFRAGAC